MPFAGILIGTILSTLEVSACEKVLGQVPLPDLSTLLVNHQFDLNRLEITRNDQQTPDLHRSLDLYVFYKNLKIGKAQIFGRPTLGPYAKMFDIQLEYLYVGKGLGTALYLMSAGHVQREWERTLASSPSYSMGHYSRSTWQRFVANGWAEAAPPGGHAAFAFLSGVDLNAPHLLLHRLTVPASRAEELHDINKGNGPLRLR